jgi:hypothetical protein
MLYPLFAFLSGIAIYELKGFLKIIKIKSQLVLPAISLLILIFGFIALWSSKPFYFNYTSDLLPKKFVITDAWGYGEYEAAQYLNRLPDAKNLIIWSDRNGICQFLLGKCISGYKIDLEKVKPDYFVLSKRGTVRYQFIWKNPELAKKSSSSYYTNNLINKPVWSLLIHGRPENFVKIVKSEE